MTLNLSTAIIAGGRSSRFGTSKLEAVYNGTRLIDHAIVMARQVSEEVFIVGGKAPLPEIHEVPVIRDVTPEIGPLGGILTGLLFCTSEWLAVMPCDAPLLSPRVYHLLCRTARSNPIVAVSSSGMEPLVSLWPKSALPVLQQSIDEGNYALRHMLCRLKADYCDVTSLPDYRDEWFLNVNYKHDLHRLQLEKSVDFQF